MPGILDMFNAQPNTTGSSNTDPLTALMQGGTPQNAAPQTLTSLLQNMFGVKPPASSPPYDDPNFNSLPFVPSQEQLARMQQLSQLFPQSRNVIDRRNALEAYPQQPLPIPQMGQGVMQSMINNSAWPRPAQPPMQRYGPGQ